MERIVRFRWLGGIVLLAILLLHVPNLASVHAQGNEFMAGHLRTDQSQVYSHTNYRMDIKAGAIPSNQGALPRDFTTGWLSVNTDDDIDDIGFFQVGLMTQTDGVHWFAFGYAGVQCLRGSVYWEDSATGADLGCRGDADDIVAIDQWHRVELEKLSIHNYWVARVYNAAGTQSWDVARILVDEDRIYTADPVFEQGYNLVNPHLDGEYWFRLPQYNDGGWQNWPYSGPSANQHSFIEAQARNWSGFIDPTHCDTYYGVTVPASTYMWEWYAGDGGADCGYILPPITYDNFNGSLTYTGSSWTYSPGCCPFAWKDGLSWTNSANDKVSLTASPANSITRVYTLAPNRGSSRVDIDGSTVALANENTTTKRWQAARTWSASGSTTIDVSNYCCGYIDADAFLIDTPRVGSATYDNMNHMLRYIGNWAHTPACCGTGTDPYDDTLSWSNQSESGVTFTFEGDEVVYVYTKHWNRGKAAITIDGEDYGVVDACESDHNATDWQAERSFDNLGSGVHTITISNMGASTCGSGSSYQYIDVDALRVP